VTSTTSNKLWFEHSPIAPKPALQLFCFPYAGGSAQVFGPWQRRFPPEVDFCLVNLPGRGKRMADPAITRMTQLVHSLADVVAPEIRGPFAFYGHSMGASISFELARELHRRHGIQPVHLFVSGRRAPQWPDDDPVTFNLPHDEFVQQLRKLNGTPREVLDSPELLEIFLPVIRADFELVDTYEYHPGEPLGCPITAYGGLQDVETPAESARAWERQTSSTFTIRMFPGDHFFVRDPKSNFFTVFHHDVLGLLRATAGA
jgi:medium-chain acyl-[acyl-carrier-protein] hydrolase